MVELVSAATYVALVTVVLVAAVWDVRFRRIPNALILSGIAIAVVLKSTIGLGEVTAALGGVGLALALLVPLFALGGVGGGDVKLLAAVAAFLGPQGFVVALLATAMVGGAMSLFVAFRRGVIVPVLFNTGGLVRYVLSFGRIGERVAANGPGTIHVPYAVAIAAGAIFAVFHVSA